MSQVGKRAQEIDATRRTARNRYPWWAPRFWHGMRWGDWWQLLRNNQFQVHPHRWAMAASITGFTAVNSALSQIADWRYGPQIAQTPLSDPPIFILGHWRSGTTYLHQLLAHDRRFVTPNTYECFVPNHFVISESWLPHLLWFVMPSKRPMDDVRAGWFEPQEDEFALCGMGIPSPYARMAFPRSGPVHWEYLDMKGLDPEALQRWQSGLYTFLQRLTYRHQKRVVLKSPTHTGRIGLLAKMFPGAKFLHLVRQPGELFVSTVRLWQSLDEVQGLQSAERPEQIQEFVLRSLEIMYDGFWSQRPSIPANSLYELRFEDLVADPAGQLAVAYDHLGLGDFASLQPALESFLQQSKQYQRHRYQLSPQENHLVQSRWAPYMDTYGYQSTLAGAIQP